jgi:hypothetical protein
MPTPNFTETNVAPSAIAPSWAEVNTSPTARAPAFAESGAAATPKAQAFGESGVAATPVAPAFAESGAAAAPKAPAFSESGVAPTAVAPSFGHSGAAAGVKDPAFPESGVAPTAVAPAFSESGAAAVAKAPAYAESGAAAGTKAPAFAESNATPGAIAPTGDTPTNAVPRLRNFFPGALANLDETMIPAYLPFSGDFVVNQLFGYFKMLDTRLLTEVQAFVQEAPTGSDATFQLVDAAGAPIVDSFGHPVVVTIPNGQTSYDLVLGTPISIAAGGTIQGKWTAVGSTTPGGYLTAVLVLKQPA